MGKSLGKRNDISKHHESGSDNNPVQGAQQEIILLQVVEFVGCIVEDVQLRASVVQAVKRAIKGKEQNRKIVKAVLGVIDALTCDGVPDDTMIIQAVQGLVKTVKSQNDALTYEGAPDNSMIQAVPLVETVKYQECICNFAVSFPHDKFPEDCVDKFPEDCVEISSEIYGPSTSTTYMNSPYKNSMS